MKIKFRVWDNKTKSFCFLDGLHFMSRPRDKMKSEVYSFDGQLFTNQAENYIKLKSQKVRTSLLCDDFSIDRYTGVDDIVGKEIYENDIVELVFALQSDSVPDGSLGKYSVFFDRGSFWLKPIKLNWLDGDNFPRPIHNFNICRVIGSVYQNLT